MATNKKLEDIEEKLNDFNCDSSCTEDEYPLAPPPEEEETQNNGGGREALEPTKSVPKPRPAYDIFPWLKELHAAMRKNLRCEYSQRHLIKMMDKCIQHLRSDIPNYLRLPNKSFILSKHITRLLMLFKDLNRNFDDSTEYLLRISELLAFYTQLELKHSTKFDEPKQLVANRLSLHYDLLLQGAHESYILRIFLHVKNCFNQKEVMRKIYEKYLKKSRITQKCELPDKLFVMYLVSYKLWKNLEDDKDEQMKVDDFANNFMKPKPTLRTNPLFAPFIPSYKAKSDDATRCILAENFNTNSLIQAIKRDDNIDSNEKSLGNIVDLSITDDLLLTDCVKTEDETASSFLLTKNIKLEKPEIVATIDLTLEEKIKAREISWLEELKRKARASEPINIATRCKSVQQSNIVAVIELDDDDDEPADVEMVSVNQEKSVSVEKPVCSESLIANTVDVTDVTIEKPEQNEKSEVANNVETVETSASEVSKPQEICEDSTKENLNRTEICEPETLILNETTGVQCTPTVQPESESIRPIDISNEVVNSESANNNNANLVPEMMEHSTINNSDVNSNSLIESEKQLIPENDANKDSVNINATMKETEVNETVRDAPQDEPCSSALAMLQDVVDSVSTNCENLSNEQKKVSLNSEVMKEDILEKNHNSVCSEILISDILQGNTPSTEVTASNSEEKSSKKANDNTPSVSNIEDANKHELCIDSIEVGFCLTPNESPSSKEDDQEDRLKLSDDEDDVIKNIAKSLSTHPMVARTYQRKKKPTIPNFNILSIPPVKDSTLLDLPAFSSSSSEFNDDSRDSNSLSILEDSEQIDSNLNTYITKSNSIDDTPIAKISPSKGFTSSKHTSESNVVFSMSSNRKVSLPPPREEFSLRESPVNNNVVFSTSKQVSVKKDANHHSVNKENILDDWNTSSDDRDNLFGDDNSTSTSTSLLEIDNDEIASPTMEQFTNSDVADVANFFGKVSLPSKSCKEARKPKSKISTENISANIPSENMKSLAKSKIERLTPILNSNPKIRFDYRDSSSNSPISNVTKKKSVSFVDSPQRKSTPTIFFPKESIILEKKTYIKSSPNPNRSSEILEPSINTYTAISFSNQHDLTPKTSLTPRISVKSTWPSPNSSPTFEDTGAWLYERKNKRKLTTPTTSLYKKANLNASLRTNPLNRFDYISAKGDYNHHHVGDISHNNQYTVINEVKIKVKHLDEKIFNSVIHLERLKLKSLTSPSQRIKRTELQKTNSSFDKYLKKKSSKAARKPVNNKSTKHKIEIEKDGGSNKISAGSTSTTTEAIESNKNLILNENDLLNDEKLRKRVIIQLKSIAHFQDNKAFLKDQNIEKTHATYCRKARSLYDAKSPNDTFEFKNENDQASSTNELLKITIRRKSESDSKPTNESTSITSKMLIQVYKKSEKIADLENIFGKSQLDHKASIVSTPVEHSNASQDKCSNNNVNVLCWKEPTVTCDEKDSFDYFQKNIDPFDGRFTSCTVSDGFSDSSHQQKETICKPETESLSDHRLEEKKNMNYTELSISINKYDERKLIESTNFDEDDAQMFYKHDQRQSDVHIEMSIDHPTAETKNSTIGGNDSVYNDNEVSSTTQQTKRIRTRRKTVTSEYNEISGADVSIKKKRRKDRDREIESNSNIRDNAPTTTTIIDSSSRKRGRPKGSRNKSKLLEENQNAIDTSMERHLTETHFQKLTREPSEDHNINAIDILTCPVSIPYTSLEVNRNLSESPEDLNVNANIKQTYSKSNFIQNVFVPPDIEQIIEAEDKVKFSDSSKVKEQQVTIRKSISSESEEADSALVVS